MQMKKLHIAVTFFYNEQKLALLEKTCSQFEHFSDTVNVHIIKNVHGKDKKCAIRSLFSN